MSQALFFNFDVKKDNNTIKVDRDFNAPLTWYGRPGLRQTF